jgi:hypothetical protein
MQHKEKIHGCHVGRILRQLDEPRVVKEEGFGIIRKLCDDVRYELVGRGCCRDNGGCQGHR